jgi:hypothetical protein
MIKGTEHNPKLEILNKNGRDSILSTARLWSLRTRICERDPNYHRSRAVEMMAKRTMFVVVSNLTISS